MKSIFEYTMEFAEFLEKDIVDEKGNKVEIGILDYYSVVPYYDLMGTVAVLLHTLANKSNELSQEQKDAYVKVISFGVRVLGTDNVALYSNNQLTLIKD